MAAKKPKPAETLVVIRRWRTEDHVGHGVLVLFPTECADLEGHCGSYGYGGHSSADYFGCIRASVPASPEEVAYMLKELKRIGYENIRVLKRAAYKHHQRRMAEARELRRKT